MTRRGVLFDVDGTLVDTNYFHVLAWWRAFRGAGHAVRMRDIHRQVGMGSDHLVAALLPEGANADSKRLSAAHDHFYAPYLESLVPFPGAADLLRATADLGLAVVLATSGKPFQIGPLRAALGADDVLTAVTDAGDVDAAKPSPDLVHTALAAAELDPTDAVMVGDTVWDVQACQRAGVPCLCLLSGGVSEQELRSAGAVAVYDGTAALLAELDASPIGALARRSGAAVTRR